MNAIAWMVGQAPTRKYPGIGDPERESRKGEARRGRAGRRFTQPQEVYDSIAELLRAGGMSKLAIAKKLNVNRRTVDIVQRRLEDGLGVPVSEPPVDAATVQRLENLVASGMSVPEAADQLMMSTVRAQGIIRHKVGMGARELRLAALDNLTERR